MFFQKNVAPTVLAVGTLLSFSEKQGYASRNRLQGEQQSNRYARHDLQHSPFSYLQYAKNKYGISAWRWY